eukprot:GHRQ01019993.1.p1 GENE.GHRQ01019993.1~~GHRQ01019993.1.p1  ORF type:complete len:207 (+),score=17.75 GHRQ01019993.1:38-658(+)
MRGTEQRQPGTSQIGLIIVCMRQAPTPLPTLSKIFSSRRPFRSSSGSSYLQGQPGATTGDPGEAEGSSKDAALAHTLVHWCLQRACCRLDCVIFCIASAQHAMVLAAAASVPPPAVRPALALGQTVRVCVDVVNIAAHLGDHLQGAEVDRVQKLKGKIKQTFPATTWPSTAADVMYGRQACCYIRCRAKQALQRSSDGRCKHKAHM